MYSQTWHTYDIVGGHIRLASPADAYVAPIAPPTTFTWTYDGSDMTRYFLQFSTTPTFANDPDTFVQIPGTGATGLSYTPGAFGWKSVKKIAAANNGLLYWRVKGQDASKSFQLWSDYRSFTIYGGDITPLPPVPNGDGTVPRANVSPQFSWDYVGSGLTRFQVQFSVNPSFSPLSRYTTTAPLPARGVTTPYLTLSARNWQKVLELDPDPANTIYWRVRGVDTDNVFYTFSAPASFTWQ
jgi:hypothetical protein